MTSYALPTSAGRPRLGQYRQFLDAYLRPQWRRAALLGVLRLASIALQLINPQIIGRFLDAAYGGARGQNLGPGFHNDRPAAARRRPCLRLCRRECRLGRHQ